MCGYTVALLHTDPVVFYWNMCVWTLHEELKERILDGKKRVHGMNFIDNLAYHAVILQQV